MLSVPIVPGALGTAMKESWYVLKAAFGRVNADWVSLIVCTSR
jgi:hypothetical protein